MLLRPSNALRPLRTVAAAPLVDEAANIRVSCENPQLRPDAHDLSR